MRQYVYDILLIGFSHLFMIMMLENILLFSVIEKKFSGALPNYVKEIFDDMNKLKIDYGFEEHAHTLLKDEEEFKKVLENYEEYEKKNNNLIIKLVLIIVNILILLILLFLIRYGKNPSNNIKINWMYLIISNIVSIIIIGIVDGIFILNVPSKIFNFYELKKDFIDYILN